MKVFSIVGYFGILILFLVQLASCVDFTNAGLIRGGQNEGKAAVISSQGMDKIRAAVREKAAALAEATSNMWSSAMENVAEQLFTEAVDSATLAQEAAAERDAARTAAKTANDKEKEWRRAATEALMEETNEIKNANSLSSSNAASGFAETGESLMTELKSPDEFLSRLHQVREQRKAVAEPASAQQKLVDQQQVATAKSVAPHDYSDEELFQEFKLPSLFD